MEHASYFKLQGSHNPFSFERVQRDAQTWEQSASSMDFFAACSNPKKRDRTVFESSDSARGLDHSSESAKRQRFGNYSVPEVDQVYERVLLWLAAQSPDRLPRTLVELEQAIQFINSFKANVDPECVFNHLVLNDFLRVSDVLGEFRSQSNSSGGSFYSTMSVSVNPYPANFEGSFLIVFPNSGAGLPTSNSLSGSSRVSQDFVTALNKAVTWLRSSLQLPTTKQGFISALNTQRDIVRVGSFGVLEFNTTPQADGQHVPILRAPAFYTPSPIL